MSTPLHSRAAVGLRPARSTPARITAEGITVHYGGPSPWTGAPGMPHARCASIWRAWQAYHIDSNGWSDIAYSSGVCPHGHRYEGRGPGRRTAANGTNTGNRVSLATCYIAGAGDPLTDDAKRGFLDEADRFGTRIRWVHHDWKPTACPGDPLTRWVRAGCPAPTGHHPPPPPPSPDPEPETTGRKPMWLVRIRPQDARNDFERDAVWVTDGLTARRWVPEQDPHLQTQTLLQHAANLPTEVIPVSRVWLEQFPWLNKDQDPRR